MKMELTWLASISASSTHAAATLLRGFPCADHTLQEMLAKPAEQLGQAFEEFGLPVKATLRNLVPLSADNESVREVAELTVLKTAGRIDRFRQAVTAVQGAVRDLELAFQQAEPDAIANLELRSRPLREQFDARGPGLLKGIAQLTDEKLVVPVSSIILVHPFRGGAGEAHLRYNSVRIEAVLANPHERLPEVLRLAWLLSMLNLDVPVYAEALRRNRLQHIAPLAMLPAALVAGEALEMCRYDQESIRFALQAWQLPVGDVDRATDALLRWWDTFHARRPRMGVALAALDRMID